jgi:hypothetical protein
MSIDILINASREAITVKTGRHFTDTRTFRAWPTGQVNTMTVLFAPDPVKAYIDLCLQHNNEDRRVPIFDEDDVFEDGPPADFKIVNLSKEHVAVFEEWVKACREEDFEIHFGIQ